MQKLFFLTVLLLSIAALDSSASAQSDDALESLGIKPISTASWRYEPDGQGLLLATDQFFAGDGSPLTNSKWASTSAGPFIDSFVPGNNINFAKVNGTGTGGSITVAAINALENFTITSTSGTISNIGNGVVPISVASGKTLDFSTQAFTSSTTAGYSLNGPGVFAFAGGTYQGGFTINSGTLVARGVNAMGSGTNNTLTINGGTIAVSANRDFSSKYLAGISIGGDFQLGALATSVPISLSGADITFNNNVSLGAATRKVTIGANGSYTLAGVISGSPGAGLKVANVPGAGGVLNLSGINTYTGPTTVLSGNLSLLANGSIANSSAIEIGSSGIFDLTTAAASLTLAPGQKLRAIGTGSSGTIALSGTRNLTTSGTTSIEFSAVSSPTVPPLAVSGAGTLALQSTDSVTVTVSNGGLPLIPRDYKLIGKGTTGKVTGTPSTLIVNGDGVSGSPTLINIANELFLRVIAANNGAIDFDHATYSPAENAGTAGVTLQRTGGSAGAVSVQATLANGTATGGGACEAGTGVDYVNAGSPFTVNFADGQTTASFNVPICDDSLFESGGPETVNLSLANPTGGATIGTQSTAVMSIIDNDTQPSIQLTATTFSIAENTGQATVTLSRTGATENAVSVGFATSADTATAGTCGVGNGVDYQDVSGTINFGVSEVSKSFNVPLCDDNLFEVQENFLAALNSPVGATLGTPNQATVSIDENDTAPNVQFSAATTTVGEDVGTVSFTVNRTGASENAFAVNFATADGTAINGPCNTGDYNSNSGTLNFAGGDPSKSFSVTICDDTLTETDENFSASLSSPTAGAVLGGVSTETTTIADNDAVADYSISTIGGEIVVTDLSNNGDNLAMFEATPGNLNFTASGRFFSIDSGPVTSGSSGDVPLAGASAITVKMNGGNDTLVVSSIISPLPTFTVHGGSGNDTAQISSAINFKPNADLNLDMQQDAAPGDNDVVLQVGGRVELSGTGTITLKASENITIAAPISTVDGDIVVEGNQQLPAGMVNIDGVEINGGLLETTGIGKISIKGHGGNSSTPGSRFGVRIFNSTIRTTAFSPSASIEITGIGGTGVATDIGVDLEQNASVTAVTGDISITGLGGPGTDIRNLGIQMLSGASVVSTGVAKIKIDGTGNSGTQSNAGVRIGNNNTKVFSSGGDISIKGHGGAGTDGNNGVTIFDRALIAATNGARIDISGIGGDGSGDVNIGVVITGTGGGPAVVQSDSGDISVTGIGGNGPGIGNIGINIDTAGRVSGTGSASVTLNGTGGSGASDCYGVGFEGDGVGDTALSAVDGNILIIGAGGTSPGPEMDGVRFEDSQPSHTVAVGMVTSGTGQQTLTGTAGNNDPTSSGIDLVNWTDIHSSGQFTAFIADTMEIGTDHVAVDVGSNTLTLVGKTPGRQITLGGNDTATELGLTDTELDEVNAGDLFIGDATSGPVITLADVTRSTSTNIFVVSGANIDMNAGLVDSGGGNVEFRPGTNFFPAKSEVDVSAGAGTLKLPNGKGVRYGFVGNATAPDSGYTQLNVSGHIDLNGAFLSLGGVSFSPSVGQSFIIVSNDGVDPVIGVFAGQLEGSLIPDFLGTGFDASISYHGGDGNDVVLTLLAPADAIPPDTSILTHPSDPSASSSATFTFDGTDNVGVASFECSLDGAAFAGCSSPQSYNGLMDGSHTFQVAAKDAAANVDATPASFSWSIDTSTASVQFSSAVFSSPEGSTATMTLTRTGSNLTGSSSVNYKTVAGGTATAGPDCSTVGNDFVPVSGSLNFGPNEVSKTFNITLCSDLTAENPAETVNFSLSDPAGAMLGTQSTSVLTLLDAATQFRSPQTIILFGDSIGSQYPSTLNVSGSPTPMGGVRVTLFGVTHPNPDSLEVLLVSPNGSAYVLMADTGGSGPLDNATITLQDVGAAYLPDSGAILDGVDYHPASCGTPGPFESPAPSIFVLPGCGPTGPQMSATFGGPTGDGTWSLYVRDDGTAAFGSPVGQIAGWGLQLLVPTAAHVSIGGRVRTPVGVGIGNVRVTVSGGDLAQSLTATTNSFGYYNINGLTSGQAYVVSASSRHYRFQQPSRAVQLMDDVTGFDFVAEQ